MQILATYAALKIDAGSLTGLDDHALHFQAGLLIFFVTAAVLRKPFWSPLPLAMVIALEALNEGIDRLGHGSWRWPDTRLDLANTLTLPLALFAAALLGRGLWLAWRRWRRPPARLPA